MGRLSRPSPSPGGVELGGGADDGDGEALRGCPTVKGPRAEAMLLERDSLRLED